MGNCGWTAWELYKNIISFGGAVCVVFILIKCSWCVSSGKLLQRIVISAEFLGNYLLKRNYFVSSI